MMKLDHVSRITKTFFKTEEFNAKHIISLANYGRVNNKDVLRSNVYCYDISDKKTRDIRKALSITTSDSIILSRNFNANQYIPTTVHGENNKDTKSGAYISLLPKDFSIVLKSIETALDWLCKDEYEKLFTIDANGNTIGVSDIKEATISRFVGGWLMFKPAVIFDAKTNAGYQGIYMKCNRGVLASLTGNEFVEFANYCKELMNNFYTASLELYNAGLLSMLYIKGDNAQ